MQEPGYLGTGRSSCHPWPNGRLTPPPKQQPKQGKSDGDRARISKNTVASMARAEDHEGPSCGIPGVRRLCRHDGRKAKRMVGSENRNLQEWLRELRPNAIWFL